LEDERRLTVHIRQGGVKVPRWSSIHDIPVFMGNTKQDKLGPYSDHQQRMEGDLGLCFEVVEREGVLAAIHTEFI
jgi:hypothetical protein